MASLPWRDTIGGGAAGRDRRSGVAARAGARFGWDHGSVVGEVVGRERPIAVGAFAAGDVGAGDRAAGTHVHAHTVAGGLTFDGGIGLVVVRIGPGILGRGAGARQGVMAIESGIV